MNQSINQLVSPAGRGCQRWHGATAAAGVGVAASSQPEPACTAGKLVGMPPCLRRPAAPCLLLQQPQSLRYHPRCPALAHLWPSPRSRKYWASCTISSAFCISWLRSPKAWSMVLQHRMWAREAETTHALVQQREGTLGAGCRVAAQAAASSQAGNARKAHAAGWLTFLWRLLAPAPAAAAHPRPAPRERAPPPASQECCPEALLYRPPLLPLPRTRATVLLLLLAMAAGGARRRLLRPLLQAGPQWIRKAVASGLRRVAAAAAGLHVCGAAYGAARQRRPRRGWAGPGQGTLRDLTTTPPLAALLHGWCRGKGETGMSDQTARQEAGRPCTHPDAARCPGLGSKQATNIL